MVLRMALPISRGTHVAWSLAGASSKDTEGNCRRGGRQVWWEEESMESSVGYEPCLALLCDLGRYFSHPNVFLSGIITGFVL